MEISVIICTHNPREEYLLRTLEAIKKQTLSKDRWELLLIDNASKDRLSNHWDISWHGNARHITENRLGLTPARLRGVKESRGKIVIFIDDDLVVASELCASIVSIAAEDEGAGGGGGKIFGQISGALDWPAWMDSGLRLFLSVRDLGDEPFCVPPVDVPGGLPPGACVWYRRKLLDPWIGLIEGQKRRPLDRRGNQLWSDGDMELNYSVIEQGRHMRYDPTLTSVHMLPAARIELAYFAQLLYWVGRSSKRREVRRHEAQKCRRPPATLSKVVRNPTAAASQLLRALKLRPLPSAPDPNLSLEEIRKRLYGMIAIGRSDEETLQSVCPWTL